MNRSKFKKSAFWQLGSILVIQLLIVQENFFYTNACNRRRSNTAKKSEAEIGRQRDQEQRQDLNKMNSEIKALIQDQKNEETLDNTDEGILSNLFKNFQPSLLKGEPVEEYFTNSLTFFEEDLNKWENRMEGDLEIYFMRLTDSSERKVARLGNFTERKMDKYYEYIKKYQIKMT